MVLVFQRSLRSPKTKPLRPEQDQDRGEVQRPDHRGQGHTPSLVKEAELEVATPAWDRDSQGALGPSLGARTMAALSRTATSGYSTRSSAGARSSV